MAEIAGYVPLTNLNTQLQSQKKAHILSVLKMVVGKLKKAVLHTTIF